MKVLMHAPNPKVESGMGRVGHRIAYGLGKFGHGHHVHYFAPGVSSPPEQREGYILHGHLGGGRGGPSPGVFGRKLNEIDPDVVLTNRNWQGLGWLADILNNKFRSTGDPTPLLLYGPAIESERKPPMFEQQVLEEHLNDVYVVPFTENRYVDMFHDWGLKDYLLPQSHDYRYVPHGVDRSVFHPEAESAAEDAPGLREGLDLGDRFVACLVGENWRRKNVDLLFDAWADFRDRLLEEDEPRPFLLLQVAPRASRSDDDFYAGWNLIQTAFAYDLNPYTGQDLIPDIDEETDVFTNKRYVGDFDPDEVIAGMMATADLYVYPTSGESFSLTSLEAMSCGTPLLQTDLPTLRWLCGDASRWVKSYQDHAINTGERMPTPSVEDLAEQLYWAYQDDEWREKASQAGAQRARDFPWNRTSDGIAAALDYIEEVSL